MLPFRAPASDLTSLASQLREIQGAHVKGRPDPKLPTGRVRAALALQAVTMFLQKQPGFAEEGLIDPLWDLQLALADLELGKQDSMLVPTRSSRSGPRGLTAKTQTIMGHAVVAMDMLVRFRAETHDVAASKIAKLLTDAGFKMPPRSKRQKLPAVIKDWHYRMETARPGESIHFAAQHWRLYNDELARGVIAADVEAWLETVKRIARPD